MQFTENSIIIMMPAHLIDPAQIIKLETITSISLVRLHRNTAVATYRQKQ